MRNGRLRTVVRGAVGKLSPRAQGIFLLDHFRGGERRRVTRVVKVAVRAIGCRVQDTLSGLGRTTGSCLTLVMVFVAGVFGWCWGARLFAVLLLLASYPSSDTNEWFSVSVGFGVM